MKPNFEVNIQNFWVGVRHGSLRTLILLRQGENNSMLLESRSMETLTIYYQTYVRQKGSP